MSTPGLAHFRQLGGALSQASPQQLARVISVIDALPDRAEADTILSRVRPRLRGKGFPRPLRFARLLFTPLDGVIVAPMDWRPGMITVPRSVLTPLAEAVHRSLGKFAERIAADCDGHQREDSGTVLELGRQLWPAATAALPATPPDGWRQTGLAGSDYAPIRASCEAGWRHGVALWPALRGAAEGPPPELCREPLMAAAAEGLQAFEIVLRLVLTDAACPAGVAALAMEIASGGGHHLVLAAQRATDQALAASMARVSAARSAPEEDKGNAAAAAARAAWALIEGFERSALIGTPQRREKLLALRQVADEACRAGFSETLTDGFLTPVTSWVRNMPADPSLEIAKVEEAARCLRRIEAAGRRLGGAETYDRALRSAAQTVMEEARSGGEASPLRRADVMRLAEILIGPDAAERLLGGLRPPR